MATELTPPKTHLIPLSRPWLSPNEFAGSDGIIEREWLISGPMVERFEEAFKKVIPCKHAIAVSTGSNALWVGQGALGIQPGDEVLVPNMTFVTTATSLMLHGAKPVFIDIEMKTYGMDPDRIEAKITPKTKGIIPVHYAGQTAEMGRILEIANRHGLWVFEDAAESHLSKFGGRFCGTLGKLGMFSFTPTKPITTGEGAMITTDDDSLAQKCRLLRNIGDTGKFQWDYLGFNFRMPEIIGVMGLSQIQRLEEFVEIRRQNGQFYNEAFKDSDALIAPVIRNREDHNFQLYTIRLNLAALSISRDQFVDELAKRGVSGRLYYPCLHHQKVFSRFERQPEHEFPNSREYEKSALSIPVYPLLTREERNQVAQTLLDVAKEFRR